jgi:hypothetical protein
VEKMKIQTFFSHNIALLTFFSAYLVIPEPAGAGGEDKREICS